MCTGRCPGAAGAVEDLLEAEGTGNRKERRGGKI